MKYNNIKFFRNYLNLTQSEFAKKLGITRQTLFQIEEGKRCLKDYEILSLSKDLKVSTDDILNGTFEKIDYNKEMMNFVKTFNDISIQGLEEILEYLFDKHLLNSRGENLKTHLWETFIKK